MNKNKNYIYVGFALIILVNILVLNQFIQYSTSKQSYEIVSKIINNNPNNAASILESLSSSTSSSKYLDDNGYGIDYFNSSSTNLITLIFTMVVILLFLTFIFINKRINKQRITEMTNYLYKVNTKEEYNVLQHNDDEFSMLEDEIYKTVTKLITTKEAAIRSKESLSENIANISHQIKTPLTSIGLLNELSSEMSVDENQKRYFNSIDTKVDHINYLVSLLLKLSKVDANVIEYKQEEINLEHLLNTTLDYLDTLIISKNISFEVKADETRIIGDSYWCCEALLNIVKNFIEHASEKDVIKVEISQNGLFRYIKISNQNVLITEEALKNMFDRYYQADTEKRDNYGIGLALSEAIIKKHNGRIIANNIDGVGSCFMIKFYEIQ